MTRWSGGPCGGRRGWSGGRRGRALTRDGSGVGGRAGEKRGEGRGRGRERAGRVSFADANGGRQGLAAECGGGGRVHREWESREWTTLVASAFHSRGSAAARCSWPLSDLAQPHCDTASSYLRTSRTNGRNARPCMYGRSTSGTSTPSDRW